MRHMPPGPTLIFFLAAHPTPRLPLRPCPRLPCCASPPTCCVAVDRSPLGPPPLLPPFPPVHHNFLHMAAMTRHERQGRSSAGLCAAVGGRDRLTRRRGRSSAGSCAAMGCHHMHRRGRRRLAHTLLWDGEATIGGRRTCHHPWPHLSPSRAHNTAPPLSPPCTFRRCRRWAPTCVCSDILDLALWPSLSFHRDATYEEQRCYPESTTVLL
jgi:hypothetical protein